MTIPSDYYERVYAGVLGKIIGVYLGRPFEGWSFEKIIAKLGEVNYFVHEKLNVPLIVTDDDIAGTFTFLRALPDHGNRRALTSAQIGESWLNYIIEKRTILWWGGLGNSTEHTAYLRLKHGIPAPASGSIAVNGKVTAEQIGAQIFIDGWAMVAPGDPELAAELAGKAASVSHDGEAVYGAKLLAAMEAQAFVEPDLDRLIDTGLRFIPKDSIIARLVNDLRDWRVIEPDWRKAREKVAQIYGYRVYPGNCHMVPNHALIHLAMLYGDNDFQKTLMIVNTCGWDTDCNSGNVGCLMGIKNGLAGIDAGPDWRGPVADRLYLSAADGGRGVSDAVAETFHVINSGLALAGLPLAAPKAGVRFHFDLPGAVQGFQVEDTPETHGTLTVVNSVGHSRLGQYSLALHYKALAPGRVARAATYTFIPPEEVANLSHYSLLASPTLYPGQTVQAEVEADAASAGAVQCGLFIRFYGADDKYELLSGPSETLAPGSRKTYTWTIPDLGGLPVAAVGLELRGEAGVSGALYLDSLTWIGASKVVLARPQAGGSMWRRAWINGMDTWESRWASAYHLVQNEGTGLIIQGTREWTDYQVEAEIKPHLMTSCGVPARVQGMRRYYALLICRDGQARLVKAMDGLIVLAEAPFACQFEQNYCLRMQVAGSRLQGWIDDQLLFDFTDVVAPLEGGGASLVVEEGCISCEAVRIS